jgi:hypothetical protein
VNVYCEVVEVFEGGVGEYKVDMCCGVLEVGMIHLRGLAFCLHCMHEEGKCSPCRVP